jgi:hypothetical protein
MRNKASLTLLENIQSTKTTRPDYPSANPDTSIGDIIRFAWESKKHVIFSGALFAFISALFIFHFRVAVPPLATYRTAITLTMPGAESGKYPNGMSFSPSDLRSPAVLRDVYKANEVEKLGLDFQTFNNMVTVEAYSPVLESIIARYRIRLDNKLLTFEERKQIEAEFEAAVSSIEGRALVVTMNIPDNWNIPAALGAKLASDIPAKWADLYLNRLGALRLPVANSNAPLVNMTLLKSLDYPLAYDYLIDQTDKMAKRIGEVAQLPGTTSLLSKMHGKSVADLQRDLDAMSEFRLRRVLRPIVELGLTKSPAMTAITYENMIGNLNIASKSNAERSRLVTGIVADVDANTAQISQNSPGGNGSANTSVMQPFDGTFVDKIIELSSKSSGVAFRETLLEKKFGFENDGVSTGELSTRLMNRLAAIRRFDANGNANPDLVPAFEAGAAAVVLELDQLWSETNDILEQANLSRIGTDKSLYVSQELPGSAVASREPLFTLRMLIIMAAATLSGAVVGFMIFGLRVIVRAPQPAAA